MTTREAIKAITSYPIPPHTVEGIVIEAGLAADDDVRDVAGSDGYKKAKALAYAFLAEAPNITQGGISYSFSESERTRFARKSDSLLAEIGEEDSGTAIACGYIGEDF